MTDILRLHITIDGRPVAFPLLSGSSASLPEDVDVFPRDLGLLISVPRSEDQRHFQDILTREGWEDVVSQLVARVVRQPGKPERHFNEKDAAQGWPKYAKRNLLWIAERRKEV